MMKGIARFCYRKEIGIDNPGAWDRYVFEDTYREFYMQAQQFDPQGKYETFREMAANIPNADKIHYLVSTAAINYIRQLNGWIPDITNIWRKLSIPFRDFRFEIVNSHIRKKELHKVAIYFYSEPLLWIDNTANGFLIAEINKKDSLLQGEMMETMEIAATKDISISHYQKLPTIRNTSENKLYAGNYSPG